MGGGGDYFRPKISHNGKETERFLGMEERRCDRSWRMGTMARNEVKVVSRAQPSGGS